MDSPSFLPTPWCQLEEILKSLCYVSFHDRSCDVASRSIRQRHLLVAAVLVLLATGCATRSSVNRLRAEVATMHTELTDLRQAQEATAHGLARTTAEARALPPLIGEVASVLKERSDEIARLRARVEAIEAEARAAKAPSPPPASVAPAPVAPPPAPVAKPPAPVTRVVPPPVQPPPAPRAERPREVPARTERPEQAYAAALATFRAREHGQAVLDFLDFIAKYPRHHLVANAQYWIGEAYYVQRDYRQALAEFQKVPEIAPGSAKAADALLKIGLCQRNLRDEARARQTWQRVVQDFPQSEAAIKARGFLKPEAGTARH
jgi:tol-pal system protein YbgF